MVGSYQQLLAYCISLSTLMIQPDDGLHEGRNM